MIVVWSAWGAASLVVVVIAVASARNLWLVAHEYRLLCGLSGLGAVVVGWAVVVDTRSRLLWAVVATSRD